MAEIVGTHIRKLKIFISISIGIPSRHIVYYRHDRD